MRDFAGSAARRLDFRVSSKVEFESNEQLRSLLRNGNFSVEEFGSTGPMDARLLAFPNLNVVHIAAPRMKALWARDTVSLDRALILVGLRGAIAVEGGARIVRRAPQLIFVPPGAGPITIVTSAEENELIYVSMAASLISDMALPCESINVTEPVDRIVLKAIVSFLGGLCRIRPNAEGVATAASFAGAAAEVARGLAQLVLDQLPASPRLHARAMEVIVRDFADASLTPALIAAQLGVAQRTLQAAFKEEGQTVARELRTARSMAARALRANNPTLDSSILAGMVGFGSRSAMFRALNEPG